MNPNAQAVLADFTARLGGQIMPQLATPYLMSSAGLMTAVMGMLAESFDGAAADLVDENHAIRGLFDEAARLSPPADLAARLEPLARGVDNDLHLSALEASNRDLRAALIELHAWAEGEHGAEALNDAIWAELSKSTERRRQSSAPF
jgi:hypothetical protein